MSEPNQPRVKALSPPMETPVFSCQLLIAPRNAEGLVIARCANMEGVMGQGESERQAMQKAVAAFKAVAQNCDGDKTKMPWIDPPLPPQEGEQPRLLAVHL